MIQELNRELLEHYERFALFGVILFTEAHPHVVKVLKDKEYYAALDDLTGDQIALFATMLFRGEYTYPSPPPGTIAMMVPIWKEPKENEEILSCFDIKDSQSLPYFVLFGIVDDEDGELCYQKHNIKADSAQRVFNSLQEILLPVCSTIRKHADWDRRKIFRSARWEMRKVTIRHGLKNILHALSLFRSVSGL